MKVNKKIASFGLASIMLCLQAVPTFAAETETAVSHPTTISEYDLDNATPAPSGLQPQDVVMPLTAQEKNYTIPGGKGTLTSNAWRQTGDGTTSGNTLQWDYQVSAVYTGSYAVETIRTTWQGSASLRNSASINLGISGSGGSAGAGSSWQNVSTVSKYWENSNGSKTADYRSNMVVTPKADYRSSTIGLVNTAKVKLKADAKPYQISASV